MRTGERNLQFLLAITPLPLTPVRVADLFSSGLLKDGDLDVACINRLRESSIAVAEMSLSTFKTLLESEQVKGNPSAYLMRMLRNRSTQVTCEAGALPPSLSRPSCGPWLVMSSS